MTPLAPSQSASNLEALIKSGEGTLTLSGRSSFGGDITINAGTLALGLDDALQGMNALTLAGGVLATGGFDQTFGTLTVSGSSEIDFEFGFSALEFSESRSIAWTSAVSIRNFTAGSASLRFGTSAGGLSASQLSLINFGAGLAAVIDANGFVTGISAVPEPSAYAAMVGCIVLFSALRRRRGAT